MRLGVARPGKDEQRDWEDDGPDHHHREAVFRIGVAISLGDLALVVALLERADDCTCNADSDEDTEESESSLSSAEAVSLLEDDGAAEASASAGWVICASKALKLTRRRRIRRLRGRKEQNQLGQLGEARRNRRT